MIDPWLVVSHRLKCGLTTGVLLAPKTGRRPVEGLPSMETRGFKMPTLSRLVLGLKLPRPTLCWV